jgi:hypothetical protein
VGVELGGVNENEMKTLPVTQITDSDGCCGWEEK